MVRHGRLADVAARREVTGADLGGVAQLAEDREPGRVGGGLQEQDVGIGLALHFSATVLTSIYIVKYQYSRHQRRKDRGARRHDDRVHPRDRPRALRRGGRPRVPGHELLQRPRDDRREPLLGPRARRAARCRRARLPRLRQPDGGGRPARGRARARPRVRRWHRRPALREARRSHRSGVRHRHDRRDARPRAAQRRRRRRDQRRVPQGAHRGASRCRPSRSTS